MVRQANCLWRTSIHVLLREIIQSLKEYMRHVGATADLGQIESVFQARLADRAIRFPRGFERNCQLHFGEIYAGKRSKKTLRCHPQRRSLRAIIGHVLGTKLP